MSATLARQGGLVQLEQSSMYLVVNMAKIARGGFSCPTVEDTQQLIKKPRAKDQEEKKHVVEFPGHETMKSEIERHPAMVFKNHKAGFLPCQNGTATNSQTRWKPKGTRSPPPGLAATPPGRPPSPRMPPAPPCDMNVNESYKIQGMPSRCVYIHSPLPHTQFFNHNAYAKHSKCDTDFIPDLLNALSAVWKYC